MQIPWLYYTFGTEQLEPSRLQEQRFTSFALGLLGHKAHDRL
jgi:hypothetical protein